MYLAAALLVLVGCNKNSQEAKENAPANYGTITGTIELPQTPNKIVAPDGWKAKTEAFKMQWEGSDKIYIYNQSECKELTVESIDAQTGNATFAGELLTDMTSYNVAYGYNPKAGTTAFAVDYIANNYRPIAAGTGEYNIFTIDKFGPVMGLKLQGTAQVKKIEVVALKGDAAQATYTMTLGTAIALNTETPTTVYFPLNDLGDADKLEAKFYRGSNAFKTQAFVTLPAKNIVTTYPTIEADPYNGHEYVDLGLPSGIMWATCNVGATTEEEYGDYFAWGETEPYYDDIQAYLSSGAESPIIWKSGKENGYSWASYFDNSTTKYNNNGGRTTLEAIDDVACQKWKGAWRMPTKAEFEELINPENCKWEYKEDYNGTGVNGCLFTSLKEGYEGNSIFLPLGSVIYDIDQEFYTLISGRGFHGFYWSLSLDHEYSSLAYCLTFNSDDEWTIKCDDRNNRTSGQSVRPVCD